MLPLSTRTIHGSTEESPDIESKQAPITFSEFHVKIANPMISFVLSNIVTPLSNHFAPSRFKITTAVLITHSASIHSEQFFT